MNQSQDDIQELKRLFKFIRKASEGVPCSYCGRLATDKEHVVPKSWLDKVKILNNLDLKIDVSQKRFVPACRECNMIAGAMVFDNYQQKKDFIRMTLKGRYHKIAHRPLWEDEEIEELSGRLREQVLYHNEALKVVKKWYKRF